MKKLYQEFKEFVSKGDLFAIAVAFVLGVTFKSVIDAITGTADKPGIVGGILGAIFGGNQPNFNDKGITLNGSFIPIGGLVTAIINFLLVGLVVFFMVKAYNRMMKDKGPSGPSEVELLTEIRDSLQNR
jgi:large conductance mechanosensitive channel